MSNEQILKKAIDKAVKNGWTDNKGLTDKCIELFSDMEAYHSIIFSHDFAKAFWGEDIIGNAAMFFNGTDKPAWQYHLQQMVLEEQPLKYLEKFL